VDAAGNDTATVFASWPEALSFPAAARDSLSFDDEGADALVLLEPIKVGMTIGEALAREP
jgi:hypothetical protein